MADFDGTDDFFDSRDLIGEIEELERATEEDYDNEDVEDLKERLETLRAFRIEVESPELEYGQTFISENYFEDYAKELCEDIGALPTDLLGFIANNIDWEGVADDIRIDYTSADLNGTTYYYR